jgi:hypothetical protein
VTTVGSGVDDAVRRIARAYNVRGLVETITSYDAPTGGSIVNQVQFDYNAVGQLIEEYQEHTGVVSPSTPSVGYSYSAARPATAA